MQHVNINVNLGSDEDVTAIAESVVALERAVRRARSRTRRLARRIHRPHLPHPSGLRVVRTKNDTKVSQAS